LKHLDPIGTICMIFFHFGWARPVPVNSRYFKKPRRDMALTSAAGPVSNFIMAFLGALVYAILYTIFASHPVSNNFAAYIQIAALQLLQYFHILNLSLGLFNLIPVPPLDGSRIFLTFLPAKYYFGIMKYERYIQLGLMILLYLGFLSRPLSMLVSWLSSGMFRVISLLPFL
ncbi:MAG: site-2 protease family protein, partial [Clostridia bacterium]|nr:site-2 protease family protein [Clostridia bacterium]